jgi:hypothetical protein
MSGGFVIGDYAAATMTSVLLRVVGLLSISISGN